MLLPLLFGFLFLAIAIGILIWIIVIPGKKGATGATGATGPAGEDAPGKLLTYPQVVTNPVSITQGQTIYRLIAIPNNSASNPLIIDPNLTGSFIASNESSMPIYLNFYNQILTLPTGMKMLAWGMPGAFIFVSS